MNSGLSRAILNVEQTATETLAKWNDKLEEELKDLQQFFHVLANPIHHSLNIDLNNINLADCLARLNATALTEPQKEAILNVIKEYLTIYELKKIIENIIHNPNYQGLLLSANSEEFKYLNFLKVIECMYFIADVKNKYTTETSAFINQIEKDFISVLDKNVKTKTYPNPKRIAHLSDYELGVITENGTQELNDSIAETMLLDFMDICHGLKNKMDYKTHKQMKQMLDNCRYKWNKNLSIHQRIDSDGTKYESNEGKEKTHKGLLHVLKFVMEGKSEDLKQAIITYLKNMALPEFIIDNLLMSNAYENQKDLEKRIIRNKKGQLAIENIQYKPITEQTLIPTEASKGLEKLFHAIVKNLYYSSNWKAYHDNNQHLILVIEDGKKNIYPFNVSQIIMNRPEMHKVSPLPPELSLYFETASKGCKLYLVEQSADIEDKIKADNLSDACIITFNKKKKGGDISSIEKIYYVGSKAEIIDLTERCKGIRKQIKIDLLLHKRIFLPANGWVSPSGCQYFLVDNSKELKKKVTEINTQSVALTKELEDLNATLATLKGMGEKDKVAIKEISDKIKTTNDNLKLKANQVKELEEDIKDRESVKIKLNDCLAKSEIIFVITHFVAGPYESFSARILNLAKIQHYLSLLSTDKLIATNVYTMSFYVLLQWLLRNEATKPYPLKIDDDLYLNKFKMKYGDYTEKSEAGGRALAQVYKEVIPYLCLSARVPFDLKNIHQEKIFNSINDKHLANYQIFVIYDKSKLNNCREQSQGKAIILLMNKEKKHGKFKIYYIDDKKEFKKKGIMKLDLTVTIDLAELLNIDESAAEAAYASLLSINTDSHGLLLPTNVSENRLMRRILKYAEWHGRLNTYNKENVILRVDLESAYSIKAKRYFAAKGIQQEGLAITAAYEYISASLKIVKSFLSPVFKIVFVIHLPDGDVLSIQDISNVKDELETLLFQNLIYYKIEVNFTSITFHLVPSPIELADNKLFYEAGVLSVLRANRKMLKFALKGINNELLAEYKNLPDSTTKTAMENYFSGHPSNDATIQLSCFTGTPLYVATVTLNSDEVDYLKKLTNYCYHNLIANAYFLIASYENDIFAYDVYYIDGQRKLHKLLIPLNDLNINHLFKDKEFSDGININKMNKNKELPLITAVLTEHEEVMNKLSNKIMAQSKNNPDININYPHIRSPFNNKSKKKKRTSLRKSLTRKNLLSTNNKNNVLFKPTTNDKQIEIDDQYKGVFTLLNKKKKTESEIAFCDLEIKAHTATFQLMDQKTLPPYKKKMQRQVFDIFMPTIKSTRMLVTLLETNKIKFPSKNSITISSSSSASPINIRNCIEQLEKTQSNGEKLVILDKSVAEIVKLMDQLSQEDLLTIEYIDHVIFLQLANSIYLSSFMNKNNTLSTYEKNRLNAITKTYSVSHINQFLLEQKIDIRLDLNLNPFKLIQFISVQTITFSKAKDQFDNMIEVTKKLQNNKIFMYLHTEMNSFFNILEKGMQEIEFVNIKSMLMKCIKDLESIVQLSNNLFNEKGENKLNGIDIKKIYFVVASLLQWIQIATQQCDIEYHPIPFTMLARNPHAQNPYLLLQAPEQPPIMNESIIPSGEEPDTNTLSNN